MSAMIFETPRLIIRKATASEADVEMYFRLWTDPRVMANVGFPYGLRITREEIRERILHQEESEYDCWLIVELKETSQPIGECTLIPPDADGVAETDVKLLPEYWGHKYGVEIKRGLVHYLFTQTNCVAVQATPNVGNTASIRMQEAVGGKRVGEAVYRFPESMREFTTPVHHYTYRVSRQDWLALNPPAVAENTHQRPVSSADFEVMPKKMPVTLLSHRTTSGKKVW